MTVQYLGEFFGTALLLLLGNGVCMTVSLKHSYGKAGGNWTVVTLGWGLSVMTAVYAVGWISGAHLNPAVTVGLASIGAFDWALVPGYIIAQVLGAILGATLAYLAYKVQMDEEPDQGTKLGVFSTGPSINAPLWNLLSEIIGTAILMIGLLAIGYGDNFTESGYKPFIVAMLIAIIGMALGGSTGYAINPARDLGPRIAHSILPIKGKGGSNWSYAWIPIVGPIIGGVIGSVLYQFIINMCTIK